MPTITQLLLFSAAASVLTRAYAPAYSIGYASNFFLLFLALVFTKSTWSIFIYPKLFSPLRHLPTPSDNDFFTGQTKAVFREASSRPMRRWIETVANDGLIYYSVWFRQRVLVTNPKTLAEVLVTKNYEFIKPGHVRDSLERILGVGLLLAEGDEHKKQRKDLMPAFNFRHVKDLYPVFWDKSREMVEHLKAVSKSTAPLSEKLGQSVTDPEKAAADAPTHAPGAIEVGEWSSRATLDIIGKAGMGRDFDALSNPNNELNRHYQNVFSLGRGSGKYWQIAGFFIPFWILKNIPNKRVSILITTHLIVMN